MSTEALSERGRFWLAGRESAHQLSMDLGSATPATLMIDPQGTIRLVLDPDHSQVGAWSASHSTLTMRRFDIVGHLTDRNEYVRLEGGTAGRVILGPHGFFPKTIDASSCLLSRASVPEPGSPKCIARLRTPLGPALPWLDQPMLQTQETTEYYEVRYPRTQKREFRLKSGKMAIEGDISRCYGLDQTMLTVTPRGWIEFEPTDDIDIDTAIRFHSNTEDLLILLTDQEFFLDWPVVETSGDGTTGTLYYPRRRPPAMDISIHECWVRFPQISDIFGTVVDNWLEMRERYGPAFHLYLSTRRGIRLWVEHRFVSLVWGLEALHRQPPKSGSKSDLDDKIKRVYDAACPRLGSKDRHWLKKLLDRSREPSLKERLIDIIDGLPISISAECLEKFAKLCADRRNDISHLGGPRGGGDYNDFALELHRLSGALDILYHTAVLQRIGIPDAIIRHVFFESIKSGRLRARLQVAGLSLENSQSDSPGD